MDSGASLSASRANASLFLNYLPHAPSSVRAVLADGSTVPSRGLVTLSLGLGSISLFLERILGGQELILPPSCLQRNPIGMAIDSVPGSDAYLVVVERERAQCHPQLLACELKETVMRIINTTRAESM